LTGERKGYNKGIYVYGYVQAKMMKGLKMKTGLPVVFAVLNRLHFSMNEFCKVRKKTQER
jgi:hypothetical protein